MQSILLFQYILSILYRKAEIKSFFRKIHRCYVKMADNSGNMPDRRQVGALLERISGRRFPTEGASLRKEFSK